MVKKAVVITLVVVAILLVTGGVVYFATRKSSTHPPPVKKCVPACKPGFVCHEGKCLPTGKCDPACRAGYQCVESKCQPIGQCNPPCIPGYECHNGKCIPSGHGACVKNSDCKNNETCINPGTPGSFCTICQQDKDCPDGICVNPATRGSFCTQCGDAMDCSNINANTYIMRKNTPNFGNPIHNNGSPIPDLTLDEAIARCNIDGSCSGFTVKGIETQMKAMSWDPEGPPPNPNDTVPVLAIKRPANVCNDPKQKDSKCVQCIQNGDCGTEDRPVCVDNFCQQCGTNADCTAVTGKPMCELNTCQADPCAPNGVGTASGTTVTCKCNTGWVGSRCQYSGATTCSGHGTPNAQGICTCDKDWYGPHCDWSNATTCSGNGTVNPTTGVCTCDSEWTGTHCNIKKGQPKWAKYQGLFQQVNCGGDTTCWDWHGSGNTPAGWDWSSGPYDGCTMCIATTADSSYCMYKGEPIDLCYDSAAECKSNQRCVNGPLGDWNGCCADPIPPGGKCTVTGYKC
jgi:hypothetical protein